jgi:hypothetical protein
LKHTQLHFQTSLHHPTQKFIQLADMPEDGKFPVSKSHGSCSLSMVTDYDFREAAIKKHT